MKVFRGHNPGWPRRLLFAAAIVSMAVNAVVPAGYMTARGNATNKIVITFCSGHGPIRDVLDLGGGAPPPAHHSDSRSVCAFAVAGAPVVGSPFLHQMVPVEVVSLDLTIPERGHLKNTVAAPALPARGPPTLFHI